MENNNHIQKDSHSCQKPSNLENDVNFPAFKRCQLEKWHNPKKHEQVEQTKWARKTTTARNREHHIEGQGVTMTEQNLILMFIMGEKWLLRVKEEHKATKID